MEDLKALNLKLKKLKLEHRDLDNVITKMNCFRISLPKRNNFELCLDPQG